MTETASSPVRGWQAFRTVLEMIKFEHSIFALPFAMLGMMWASERVNDRGWPGGAVVFWIIVAMVSCRSAAMAFNRIVDRDIDAINPRTRMRAIPAGLLRLKQVNLFLLGAIIVFVLAAGMLNPLALALSPVALIVTLGYSLSKRFTPFCHLILGFSLGFAPAAAWIGVTGSLDPTILWLTAAVTGWTAGFDIIYALQDEEFDRENRLHSLPVRLGKARALGVSRALHLTAIACLVGAGYAVGAGLVYYIGVLFAAALLGYEQSLVKPNDLSKVNLAFFTLNGFVSIGVFVFALIDAMVRG